MKVLFIFLPVFLLSWLSFPLINEFASLSEDLIPKEIIFLIAFAPVWLLALIFALGLEKEP